MLEILNNKTQTPIKRQERAIQEVETLLTAKLFFTHMLNASGGNLESAKQELNKLDLELSLFTPQERTDAKDRLIGDIIAL